MQMGVWEMMGILVAALLGVTAICALAVWRWPQPTIRFGLTVLGRLCYRVHAEGVDNVPRTGGVLLIPNHVTWLDGILLSLACPRKVRFVVFADYVHHPWLNWLLVTFQSVPIKSHGGPKALVQSLKAVREALESGECVCVFAEGTLTRTGQLQPFQPGFLKMLPNETTPIVPVFMLGLWGSIFSYRGGKFLRKWPTRGTYPIWITFGKPICPPVPANVMRQQVLEIGVDSVERRRDAVMVPPRSMLRACRRGWKETKVADSTGQKLTAGRLMIASLALRQVLMKRILGSAADEPRVGIFLPSTVADVLANAAVTLAGRVAVNLNFTLSDQDIHFCCRDAGLKHVLTSRKMLEKRPIEFQVPVVYLEDLRDQITALDKVWSLLCARVLPAGLVDWLLGTNRVQPDDPLTIIYTSGSTGEPKGVVLTHHNVAATIDAVHQVFEFDEQDNLLGVLPIFHSFGYLTTLWLPLCLKPRVVFHPNPLDARLIGELAQEHKATILFATPTFLRNYMKRCSKEQFATVNLVVVGAEKLPRDLAEQFQEKFGILPMEGYGTTETSGPAAVNIPDHRCSMVTQNGSKLGTVGRTLPGVAARIVDPETRVVLPIGQEGLIEIKGVNIMKEYYRQPEKTATVLKDGWYNTGDMGRLDDEGFLQITGRFSRFSKIGGEMVPHLRIEEELLKIASSASEGEDTGPLLAVTAVPDAKKGERLIVLHRPIKPAVSEIIDGLAAVGLPNLWLPTPDSFIEVAAVPMLGTGKLDLKRVKTLAMELTGAAAVSPQA
jgi:acyl-[acyl-carrier-protein]-phospholipid O-acyltransferase / long-chain-fatty-acid--[acyl-carrier-protein] ligase